MLLKTIALTIYKPLPDFIRDIIVRILFPTHILAAKVYLTNEQGKFLVVKTTYNTGWDLPSGHVDRKESPDNAASRELFEETGIVHKQLQQKAVVFQPLTGTVQVLFAGTLDHTPEPTPDNVEISEARWISRGEVDCNPYALEALEVLLDHKTHYWVSKLHK
ncbi:hypothetical protein AB833_10780 [Chromatiales bacterium (ex Bugula neritina AB1)]|nr:hypothetical protein AB833_10780 [Chromatiales bacterium (ex Bugula neritina AB1)]